MKLIKFVAVSFAFLLLTACSFKPLSRDNFPPDLRTLNYAPQNPNGALATEIKRRLLSAGITFNDNSKIKLVITKANFITNQPVIFYSGNAVNYNYTLSTSYSIYKNDQLIAGPKSLTVSRSMLHNANQAYTSGEDIMMLRELTQELATATVFDLTSLGVHHVIGQFDRNSHAKQRPAVL